MDSPNKDRVSTGLSSKYNKCFITPKTFIKRRSVTQERNRAEMEPSATATIYAYGVSKMNQLQYSP
jgi:hypothetical protein